MIVWAISLIAKDELVPGKLYNVYGVNGNSFFIELSKDHYKNFDKKFFVADDDPTFARILTYANVKGVLQWEKET
jgi:hypothetical protein